MKLYLPAFCCLLSCASYGVCAQVGDFQHIDFQQADSIASLYQDHPVDSLHLLAMKLTTPLESDVEKFRAIYKWVCDNIENDFFLFRENQRKRQKLSGAALEAWNAAMTARMFETLRREHRTICTGYAYLVKELSAFAGIQAEVVDGYGRTIEANIGGAGIPNHSWNAVKLGDKWYLCDPTWSSGVIDPDAGRFIQRYDDAWFLADPAIFFRKHYPLDTAWLLLDDKPALDEFLTGPIIYSAAVTHGVTDLFPKTLELVVPKGTDVTFHFRTERHVPGKLELEINKIKRAVTARPHPSEPNTYMIDHLFKKKGGHTVHLLFDGAYVATYDVVVR